MGVYDEPVGIEKLLVEKIRPFRPHSPHFIIGVRAMLETDEERQELMDAIDNGEINSGDDVILYALAIDEDRDGVQEGLQDD